ncbi:MAG: hypothetical protein JW757_05055 [Anaerolineales bacterium]|nr:hypothetical protein [Anaerolineales bacterium]
MDRIRVFVEEGQKKIFVVALDWPGWARWGKNEHLALVSLLDYAPRYARVMDMAGIGFQAPGFPGDFEIIARVEGNAITSFGAPDVQVDEDQVPLSQEEFQHSAAILRAAWDVFDRQVDAARGKELRKGPRGGGRDLEKIILHTLQADEAYLKRLARKFKLEYADPLEVQTDQIRAAIRGALAAGMSGEIPEEGPRGGKTWPLRFYLRRVIWHTLDHAWEIEDRRVE